MAAYTDPAPGKSSTEVEQIAREAAIIYSEGFAPGLLG
jgi:hypothetical protein